MNKKQISLIAIIVIAVLTFLFANPFGYNESGFRTFVQGISGSETVQFEPGIYYKGFMAKTTQYPDVMTIVYTLPEHSPKEGVSSLNAPASIRFNDAANAKAEATIKWRLPFNEKEMIMIHKDNRSPEKFVQSVLEPYTGECLSFSAQLLDSEEHYSGGKSKMSEDFQDQLEKGQFIITTKTEEVQDTISGLTRKFTETHIRTDNTGQPIRRKSNVLKYGMVIVSAVIKDVDYDPIIDEKLKAKIDASTKESISKQLAVTAKQEALTAIEQGKKLIAQTRATEEADKIKLTIQAQKATAVAEENLKQAKLNAASELAMKKAQAEGDKLKVAAGLSPKEKAEYKMKTAIGVAEALSKRPVPTIVTNGGGNQSGLASSYTMEQMLLIQDKLSE